MRKKRAERQWDLVPPAAAIWQGRLAQNWGHERRIFMDIKYRAPATRPERLIREALLSWFSWSGFHGPVLLSQGRSGGQGAFAVGACFSFGFLATRAGKQRH